MHLLWARKRRNEQYTLQNVNINTLRSIKGMFQAQISELIVQHAHA